PREEALQKALLSAQALRVGVVAETREVGFERGQLAPRTLLVGSAERRVILRALDAGDFGLELDAASVEPLESDLLEPLLDRRQPLLERAAAGVEDVVERAEARAPRLEVAEEQLEVSIVLQRLLEAVRRQEL